MLLLPIWFVLIVVITSVVAGANLGAALQDTLTPYLAHWLPVSLAVFAASLGVAFSDGWVSLHPRRSLSWDGLVGFVFLAGLVIALLIIDTPRIHAATDPDRCVVQRYLTETHLAKPEVQAELDGLTPSQRQKVLVEMTRMIHQHSLDRVYLVERQRVRRGAPDVCGVGREGDPR